nr:SDR family oxidoreductase [Microbacterium bovistercoris]
MTRLDGKRVIITGAGDGLGRAYALACADAGASIVVNDVDAESAVGTVTAIRERSGFAVPVIGSVASWTIAEELTRVCIAEFGGVDGLVANAGIMRQTAPWDATEADLRAIAEVNILGVQFCARHAMRAMLASGGSIVTVVSGAQHGIRGMSAYGASKGAVNAMTRNWAIEGSDHSIRVNAVSPLGLTNMSAQDARAERPDLPPTGRIAPVVVALLSDDTASVSGRIIRFDGAALSSYQTVLAQIATSDEWTADAVSQAITAFPETAP